MTVNNAEIDAEIDAEEESAPLLLCDLCRGRAAAK
jgi:hypothetical protein